MVNEPKKRGRPSKAEIAAREAEAGITMSEPENPDPRPFYEVSETASGIVVVEHGERLKEAAQAYALRIWAKQSVSLSRHERVGRIAAALEDQGLSMEGVELP